MGVDDLAKRLATDLGKPILLEDIPFTTSKGIGIAEYPRAGIDAEEIVRAATSAAHEALEEGTLYRHHDPSWDDRRKRVFRLLRGLTLIPDHGCQLSVEYQPKIALRTQECIGSEALLRWNHPELGPISPGEFIPLAEQTTIIRRLTDWLLETVLAQVSQWHAKGLRLRTSINVSVVDVSDEDFARRLSMLMNRHGIVPEWIDIEITESVRMNDPAVLGRQMTQIKQLGVEIGIDDFGTGQSALSYFKHIPASFVKIDQTFIRCLDRDQNDRILVRSTIDMAHDLGIFVVAEGIESLSVLDWLHENGCDQGQGYVISRPLKAHAFENWARARTA